MSKNVTGYPVIDEILESIAPSRQHEHEPVAQGGRYSPLPWKLIEQVSEYAHESADSHYAIWADDDMTIAVTVKDCVDHEQGNAQLIVTAVNQYHSLLAERERLRKALARIRTRCEQVILAGYLKTSSYATELMDIETEVDEALNEQERR